MELKDTIELMNSDDFKERFKAEYYQTRIRCTKLGEMIAKYEAGTLPFKPKCDIEVYKKQRSVMLDYLSWLAFRSAAEGIPLEQGVITIEAKNILRYVCVAAVIIFLFHMFCGARVSDDGNGTDKVRVEIEAAGQSNQELQDRLEVIEGGADKIATIIGDGEAAISRAETAAERIAENLAAAERNNRECQSILSEVRRRSEAERAKN